MFFLPYKLDSELYKIPYVTLFICIICIFIYWNQYRIDGHYQESIQAYCNTNIERGDLILIRKITHQENGNQCKQLFESIRKAHVPKDKLEALALESDPMGSFATAEDDYNYRLNRLQELYRNFAMSVPEDLTGALAYDPKKINLVNMITSTFSHADVLHLLGNLLFFYIFSASVELIFGGFLYLGFILLASLGTSLAYSYAVIGVEQALPTIGLSGVVMASVAALAVMLPTARIRCFFWFIFFFRIIRIPALLLAVWYIGWDFYEMNLYGDESNINYVAHISGAGIGAIFGIIYYLFRRDNIHATVQP
ncbi:MAG: rhomboid family intramembrane serine protease [Candidatus Thiodiazotropha sp.]